MIPEKGVTPHPGEMLLEEYLKPMGITQAAFGAHIGMDTASLSAIIHGKRNLSPRSAMKIARALNMTPEFWMNLQTMHDLTKTREDMRRKQQLPKFKPMPEVLEAVGAE
jgi:addiction module HigA family antidote